MLKAGCQKFVQEFKSVAEFDPMEKWITIAQACNRYWRKCVMEEETIALEPNRGWSGARDPHSHIALKWLMWEAHTRDIRIRHARNGGEKIIHISNRSYKVDGYHAPTRTCYEFHGCLYHGCRSCFQDRKRIPHFSQELNFEALRRQTEQKTQALRQAGYIVEEMWECEFAKKMKTNEALKEFVQSIDIVTPLNPRDAFYGGRTGVTTLDKACEEGEQIRYLPLAISRPAISDCKVL